MTPPPGLSSEDAARRLRVHGPNELRREDGTPAVLLLVRQFRNPMVALLLAACAVAASLGEVLDASAIASILVLNALVGFFQEHRAEKAILALRSMTAPRARVLRDGRAAVIPAVEVVPGDVLLLEAGDVVAADARLVEAHDLRTGEAALTGESVPVEKSAEPAPAGAPLAERRDRVFLGTSVATGTGLAEVVATGMGTEMGRIAGLLATAERGATPLQVRLAQVGRTLALACLGIVAVVFLLGFLRGEPWIQLLLASIALAVAAVPEGLPAIVTIALAVGVQRMARRNVLVRRLHAVETLGCTSVICTDKTGTLTAGVMAVRETWGPDPEALLRAAASCCNAELHGEGEGGTGDPTEIAILLAARERGIERAEIERRNPRVRVRPFDPGVRRMSILREDGVLYVKGALEALLPLSATGTGGAAETAAAMGGRGLRVLAVATGASPEARDFALLGLLGLADPPRPEAVEAVRHASRMGIRTVMITGDHRATAETIAREMGILGIGEAPEGIVLARATPEDKIRTVREWKRRGHVVGMTGDGVNDAPAIREAHVGIAMGRTGTEVTREAADVVLADDNYASIVAGVQEGRGIFENIRKTLVYLLAGNAGELLVMLGTALAGLPLPLLPIHLLWVNLVTDGLPALTLVMDPPGRRTRFRPPRNPAESLLGAVQWGQVLGIGVLDALVVLSVYLFELRTEGVDAARTLAFLTLVCLEVLRALAARSTDRTFWEVGPTTNRRLVQAVLFTLALQGAVHALPAAARVFRVVPLHLPDVLLGLSAALVPVSVLEAWKLLRRWLRRGSA